MIIMKHPIKLIIISGIFISIILLTSCKKETLLSLKADFMYKKEFKYFGVAVDNIPGTWGISMYTGNFFGIDKNGNVKILFKDTTNIYDIKICKGTATELYALVRRPNNDIILKKYDLAEKVKTKEFNIEKTSFGTYHSMFYNPNDNYIYVISGSGLVRINTENGKLENVINKKTLSDIRFDAEYNNAYYIFGDTLFKYDFASSTSIFLIKPLLNTSSSYILYNNFNSKKFLLGADLKIRETDIPNQTYGMPLYQFPFDFSGLLISKDNKFTYTKSGLENELYEVDLENFSEKIMYLNPHINGSYMNEICYSNY